MRKLLQESPWLVTVCQIDRTSDINTCMEVLLQNHMKHNIECVAGRESDAEVLSSACCFSMTRGPASCRKSVINWVLCH